MISLFPFLTVYPISVRAVDLSWEFPGWLVHRWAVLFHLTLPHQVKIPSYLCWGRIRGVKRTNGPGIKSDEEKWSEEKGHSWKRFGNKQKRLTLSVMGLGCFSWLRSCPWDLCKRLNWSDLHLMNCNNKKKQVLMQCRAQQRQYVPCKPIQSPVGRSHWPFHA